jgi:hypothetical protein
VLTYYPCAAERRVIEHGKDFEKYAAVLEMDRRDRGISDGAGLL